MAGTKMPMPMPGNRVLRDVSQGMIHQGNRRAARPLLTLTEVLESRYEDLSDHGETVACYCEMIARRLELPHQTVEMLRLAGCLHDVGKVAVDEEILRKPGPLTDDEWKQVKRHPEVGADLLFSANLGRLASWVLAHHERPDGRGYPFGMTSEEIPLPARILAVADAYDAMTTDRVYKAAMSHAYASRELRDRAGEQFDPAVVEGLLCELDGC